MRQSSNVQHRPLDRRRLLRTAGVAAGTATLLAAPAAVRASEPPSEEVAFDVALDGRTFRLVRANQGEPDALPATGDTFVMYGNIYPAGTFDQGSTSPEQAGAIGRWICRGTFNVDLASGGVPHVMTTVLHILDEGLSLADGAVEDAPDALIHEGLESGVPVTRRAVTGGYGAYAGVRGEALQEFRGENETMIEITPEIAMPAASYTFTFTLDR